jgi:putative redox protein
MELNVRWEKELRFRGTSANGSSVLMDSHASAETGVSPVEMVGMSLAACTGMDVISILTKMRQDVTSFDVKMHGERAAEYPKVITSARLEYVVVGRGIAESALLTAIDRSIKKYCPVHAMLKHVFPIELHYSIYEVAGEGEPALVKSGMLAGE